MRNLVHYGHGVQSTCTLFGSLRGVAVLRLHPRTADRSLSDQPDGAGIHARQLLWGYYINPKTHTFDDPPVTKTLTTRSWTIQAFVAGYTRHYPVFQKIAAAMAGNTSSISLVDLWQLPTPQPSYLSLILPLMVLQPTLPSKSHARMSVYAQTPIDATTPSPQIIRRTRWRCFVRWS